MPYNPKSFRKFLASSAGTSIAISSNKPIHKLKIHPEYFEAVCSGKKSFEIRENDRDFKIGDTLMLQEYDPQDKSYTGRVIERRVTYITDFSQKENYVVMSIV